MRVGRAHWRTKREVGGRPGGVANVIASPWTRRKMRTRMAHRERTTIEEVGDRPGGIRSDIVNPWTRRGTQRRGKCRMAPRAGHAEAVLGHGRVRSALVPRVQGVPTSGLTGPKAACTRAKRQSWRRSLANSVLGIKAARRSRTIRRRWRGVTPSWARGGLPSAEGVCFDLAEEAHAGLRKLVEENTPGLVRNAGVARAAGNRFQSAGRSMRPSFWTKGTVL